MPKKLREQLSLRHASELGRRHSREARNLVRRGCQEMEGRTSGTKILLREKFENFPCPLDACPPGAGLRNPALDEATLQQPHGLAQG